METQVRFVFAGVAAINILLRVWIVIAAAWKVTFEKYAP